MAMSMATKISRSIQSLRSPPVTVASLTESLATMNLTPSMNQQSRFYKVVDIQKMKFKKYRKGRIDGIKDGAEVCFGKYGLQALEPARITAKQIEAGRKALTWNVRRGGKGGKVWVRVFPYKSVTAKPSEVRMGRGKGAISHWVAPVKPGQIIYEMGGVNEVLAKRAIQIAGSKMPIQTRAIIRDPMTKEIGIR
ncbi:large ribosomal subunit protein uL16c [Rutidosis leptorrhynchoides]|uniref:large ribosomal subunit protein uL16c n=1 Tax=Rutidosis leptorrhynchoides TaxID=125765 RepID=UPI003A99EEB4